MVVADVTLKANDPEGPRLLVNVFKTALPTAGEPLAGGEGAGNGVTITGSGQAKYLTISFRSAVSGLLSLTSTVGGVADGNAALNAGVSIAVNVLYQATVLVAPGETINLIYDAAGGVYTLRIAEVVQT